MAEAANEARRRRIGIAIGITVALVISAAIAIPIACVVRDQGAPVVPVTRPAERP